MRARTRGFRSTLTRALAVAVTVFVVVAGYVVLVAVHDASTAAPSAGAAAGLPSTTPWHSSYSRRFPGCVALLLWPSDEAPRGFVVRQQDGAMTRLSVRDTAARVRGGQLTEAAGDDVGLVGVCR